MLSQVRTSGTFRFEVRLFAALLFTLLVVGAAQYVLGARQLTDRVLEQTLTGYEGDAEVVVGLYADSVEDPWPPILELIGHIAHRPAVIEAALVDDVGRVRFTGSDAPAHGDGHGDSAEGGMADEPGEHDEAGAPDEPGVHGHDPHLLPGELVTGTDRVAVHHVLGSGEPVALMDEEYQGDVAVYAVPLVLDGDSYVLIVETESDLLAKQQRDLRRTLITGLVLAVLLALPVFHFSGGRHLASLHRHHVDRGANDGLTGLRNHRSFQEYLRDELDRAHRGGGSLSLALLDLDGFKLVNDTAGHRKGDEILERVGAILSDGRDGDAAFRVGGDEFALVLPSTGVDGAQVVAERLRDRVTDAIPEIGVSVGLAELRADEDLEALLSRADAALYRAKHRGRSLVVAFEQLGEADADATLSKGSALRALLDAAEMHVAFQPILALQDGSVLGYEALARPPQVAGFDGPAEAFGTAERLGLVPELDRLCRQAVLARAGDLPDGAWLFLNVSPSALDNELLDWDRLALDATHAGLHPARVVVELTERSRVPALVLRREVAAARRAGFRIAIDDAGAGSTGFECLRAVDPDIIKIDRSVVAHAAEDVEARATLLAILSYAAVTGAEVIGEGVEDHGMLEVLRAPAGMGFQPARVMGVQGYLFGRPAERPLAPAFAPRS